MVKLKREKKKSLFFSKKMALVEMKRLHVIINRSIDDQGHLCWLSGLQIGKTKCGKTTFRINVIFNSSHYQFIRI